MKEITQRDLDLVTITLARMKFYPGQSLHDDAFSGGMDGLWQAAIEYEDAGRWEGFASFRIRLRAIDELRKVTHRGARPLPASIEAFLESTSTDADTYRWAIATDDTEASALANVEIRELVGKVRMVRATRRAAAIARMTGITQRDFAKRMGFSPTRARKHYQDVEAVFA